MQGISLLQRACEPGSPEDYRRLLDWFRTREDALWDQQIDQDSLSGRLGFLFKEAGNETEQRQVKSWPLAK